MEKISKEKFIEEYYKCVSLKGLKSSLGCSNWTIQDRIKKYGLPKKEVNKEVILSEQQMDIIMGALLGDGSIIRSKRCKNGYFQYLSSEKEHVEYIYSFLKDLVTNRYKNGPVENKITDKRTGLVYTNYSIRTQNNVCFEKIRIEWYKGIKIIPDIELNPMICKVWYLGDGGIINGKSQVASQYIKLSTDGFDPIYVQKIVKKLSNFQARIQYRSKDKNQSTILIPRIKIKKFLSYIGDCPIKCYEHKWNYIPCKSNKVEVLGISSIKESEKDILNDFNGGVKIINISKKYGCSSSLIRYYLLKNNLI
jgi:hypothetical protein